MKLTLLFLLISYIVLGQSAVMKDSSYNFSNRSEIEMTDIKGPLTMDTSSRFDNNRNIVSFLFLTSPMTKDSIYKASVLMLVDEEGIVKKKAWEIKFKNVSIDNNVMCVKECLNKEEEFIDPNGHYHYVPPEVPIFALYWYIIKINGKVLIHFSDVKNKSMSALIKASDWIVMEF